MDMENGYYLAKFQNIKDYEKVLTQGPWSIYRQYLTIQLWNKDFSQLQPYPSVVMAWIRLSRLSRFMCKRRMLEAIEGMVVKIAKLDFNTDSRTMGRFARMAVFINLDGPLVSQVLVNSETPWVEYRALPTICFSCGRSDSRGYKDKGIEKERSGSIFAALNGVGEVTVVKGVRPGSGQNIDEGFKAQMRLATADEMGAVERLNSGQ
ncbi:hypothetical protein Goshw_029313 [Gossypium schwendimanii]|uniref:DUF4283 domain-containing protein n=1 Tax=Gossypium schwendimanii TaxID=34291 RepID=A0A7J9MA71_GOSSC|nr:hypothetical protein [Gossypium schwendimanii]